MYERHYGYLYDRDRRVKDDAKLIRSTIKTMAGAGILPADWKYSVRYRTFAGGCSIDVTAYSPRPTMLMHPGQIRAAEDRDRLVRVPIEGETRTLRIPAGTMHEVRWCDVVTPEAQTVQEALKELLDACNHDGSDSQTDYFDVKFYGWPELRTMPGVAETERERPSFLPASCSQR